jgi:hypothetical protein
LAAKEGSCQRRRLQSEVQKDENGAKEARAEKTRIENQQYQMLKSEDDEEQNIGQKSLEEKGEGEG